MSGETETEIGFEEAEEMDAGNIVPGVIKVGTDREGKTG